MLMATLLEQNLITLNYKGFLCAVSKNFVRLFEQKPNFRIFSTFKVMARIVQRVLPLVLPSILVFLVPPKSL